MVEGPVLERYIADPTNDAELRAAAKIPEDAYYTVGVEPMRGLVTIEPKRKREVRGRKISKSP